MVSLFERKYAISLAEGACLLILLQVYCQRKPPRMHDFDVFNLVPTLLFDDARSLLAGLVYCAKNKESNLVSFMPVALPV